MGRSRCQEYLSRSFNAFSNECADRCLMASRESKPSSPSRRSWSTTSLVTISQSESPGDASHRLRVIDPPSAPISSTTSSSFVFTRTPTRARRWWNLQREMTRSYRSFCRITDRSDRRPCDAGLAALISAAPLPVPRDAPCTRPRASDSASASRSCDRCAVRACPCCALLETRPAPRRRSS
jgi:hypothetical protein